MIKQTKKQFSDQFYHQLWDQLYSQLWSQLDKDLSKKFHRELFDTQLWRLSHQFYDRLEQLKDELSENS